MNNPVTNKQVAENATAQSKQKREHLKENYCVSDLKFTTAHQLIQNISLKIPPS